MTVVGFVLAAAVGGVVRWAVIRWWYCSWHSILAVNVAGSALLGWLVEADVSTAVLTVIGAGLAGSLTTFSTFAAETLGHRPRFAAAYVALTLVGCLGAAGVAASF